MYLDGNKMAAILYGIAAISPAGYLQLHEYLAIPVGIRVGILTILYVTHTPSVVRCR